MGFVLGSLFNPATNESDLLGRERLVAGSGGHAFVLFGRDDAPKEFALVGGAWFHNTGQVFFAEQACLGIEAQVGFSFVVVRSVAEDAIVGQDGPDIAIELDVF